MTQQQNAASMCVMWQRLSAESYRNMVKARRSGNLKKAAYFQRQQKRDHKIMMQYLLLTSPD